MMGRHVITINPGAKYKVPKGCLVPNKYINEVAQQIQNLMDEGLLKKSHGPYVQSIAWVSKLGKDLRIWT